MFRINGITWNLLGFHVFPVVFGSGLDGFVSLGVALLACALHIIFIIPLDEFEGLVDKLDL